MISYIQGKFIEKTPTYIIVECGGMGYHINISLYSYSKLKDEINGKVYTHQVIKEDAHILYGFAEEEERKLFRNLISVSGIGASTARMILSSLTPMETQLAIINGDIRSLQNIKGIGAKSAQRIIIDLKDKLSKEEGSTQITTIVSNTIKEEALSALLTLGFVKSSAEKVIDEILKKESELSVEKLIKLALKNL